MENKNYYFVNVVEKNINKIIRFSREMEETFNKDTLTGINFAEIKDSYFLLGLVFKTQHAQKEAIDLAEKYSFKKIYKIEENWIDLMMISKVCIVGNFTYKMLKGGNEIENDK